MEAGDDDVEASFAEGTYNVDAFIAAGVTDNTVISMKVEGVDGCLAIVYQHSLTGWAIAFPVGTYDKAAFVANGARVEDASSIKVRTSPCVLD